MSTGTEFPTSTRRLPPMIRHELARLRKDWWWFLLLGILLAVGGLFCLAYPFVSSVTAVVTLGTVMIIGGIATLVAAFFMGRWSALLVQLLIGILYVVAGMAMVDVPAEAVALLTLFVAAFFLVAGLFRIVAALMERFPQWGWVLLNGVVTVLIGLTIFRNYPASALWALGVLLGIELLFHGWTWIMLALMIRRFAVIEEETPA